jgi:hypothetical protein
VKQITLLVHKVITVTSLRSCCYCLVNFSFCIAVGRSGDGNPCPFFSGKASSWLDCKRCNTGLSRGLWRTRLSQRYCIIFSIIYHLSRGTNTIPELFHPWVNFKPSGLYSLFHFVCTESTEKVTRVPWYQTMKAFKMGWVKVRASLLSTLDGGEKSFPCFIHFTLE